MPIFYLIFKGISNMSFLYPPKFEPKLFHKFFYNDKKKLWSHKLPPHCIYRRLDFPLLNKFTELVDICVIQVTLDLMISMNFRGTIINYINMGFHLLHSTYLCPFPQSKVIIMKQNIHNSFVPTFS